MYKETPPVKGDLRYEVQPVYKKPTYWSDSFTPVRHDRTLQQYDGHEWKDLKEFYKPMIEI